jgi:hypothetical protein
MNSCEVPDVVAFDLRISINRLQRSTSKVFAFFEACGILPP